jgi:L-rhamnose isomerase
MPELPLSSEFIAQRSAEASAALADDHESLGSEPDRPGIAIDTVEERIGGVLK